MASLEIFLGELSRLLRAGTVFAPLIALLAGLLTSITPCSLTSVPLVIGYVGSDQSKDPKRAMRLSILFALGMSTTFLVLGVSAALLGRVFSLAGNLWYLFLGVLMTLMALQTWGVIQIIPSTHLLNANTKRGMIGAFFSGILAGIFSSPCTTPVLIALMSLIAREGNMGWGLLLFGMYSIGHSLIVILAGSSIGFVEKLKAQDKDKKTTRWIQGVLGGLMLILALWMFYLGF